VRPPHGREPRQESPCGVEDDQSPGARRAGISATLRSSNWPGAGIREAAPHRAARQGLIANALARQVEQNRRRCIHMSPAGRSGRTHWSEPAPASLGSGRTKQRTWPKRRAVLRKWEFSLWRGDPGQTLTRRPWRRHVEAVRRDTRVGLGDAAGRVDEGVARGRWW